MIQGTHQLRECWVRALGSLQCCPCQASLRLFTQAKSSRKVIQNNTAPILVTQSCSARPIHTKSNAFFPSAGLSRHPVISNRKRNSPPQPLIFCILFLSLSFFFFLPLFIVTGGGGSCHIMYVVKSFIGGMLLLSETLYRKKAKTPNTNKKAKLKKKKTE